MCLHFAQHGRRPAVQWILVVALLAFGGRTATAQSAGTDGRAKGTTVNGFVFDSLARRALVGAVVQLVATDGQPHPNKTASSDTAGWYEISDVPDGAYAIGFLHAMLDSLGLDPPLRALTVRGARPMRLDIGVASPARLRRDICGARATAQTHVDSGALVMGIVRDAATRTPIADASVAAEWHELAFTMNGMVPSSRRILAKSAANGWFALCDVPDIGTITVTANHGADSTGRVEWPVPASGFLRGDLYIRAGRGRLVGRVVSSGDQPIAGARVSLVDGPRTLSDADGRWMLAGVPTGTRQLEVRAIGFLPSGAAVHVLEGAAPVQVELSPIRTFLDTVKVTAMRERRQDLLDFDDRRRSGASMGRFLTAADITRHALQYASKVFRYVPGVHLESDRITVRGAFGECSPSLWLNGHYVPTLRNKLTADDVDDLVAPERIAGIEVYFDQVPPMFQWAMSGCGSIVIWTK